MCYNRVILSRLQWQVKSALILRQANDRTDQISREKVTENFHLSTQTKGLICIIKISK